MSQETSRSSSKGQRIKAITSLDDVPAEVERVDLRGFTVLPGLIDAHTHPLIGADDYQIDHLKHSSAYKTLRGLRRVQDALQAGWTSIRIAGDADAAYGALDLAKAISDGLFVGPRITAAGHYLSTTGGGGDINFISAEHRIVADGRIVDGPDEIRKTVREEVKHGARWIKLLVTGAFMSAGDDPRQVQFSPEELRAAVEEANRRGVPVMAHAHATAGIKAAIKAGVRSIEHGTFIDEEASNPPSTPCDDRAIAENSARPAQVCHGIGMDCKRRSARRSTHALWSLAALTLTAACPRDDNGGDPSAPDATPAPPICSGSYGRVLDQGALTDDELVEASGLAASRQSPGVLWSHNDSGDGARLFALRDDGRALARLYLPGIQAIDFEDLAIGPCPEAAYQPGPCLWIADTGNNLGDRTEVSVYATPEPSIALGQDAPEQVVDMDATQVWHFPVTYPDPPGEPMDIEAMVMAADGQSLYFFEKNNEDRARILHHPGPLEPGQSAQLVTLGDFASPGLAVDFGRAVTAADLHPTGERMLLRVYTAVYEYRFAAGQGIADLDAMDPFLVAAGPLTEPQGETVTYDAAGSGVYSVSEDPDFLPGQQLHFYPCEP